MLGQEGGWVGQDTYFVRMHVVRTSTIYIQEAYVLSDGWPDSLIQAEESYVICGVNFGIGEPIREEEGGVQNDFNKADSGRSVSGGNNFDTELLSLWK